MSCTSRVLGAPLTEAPEACESAIWPDAEGKRTLLEERAEVSCSTRIGARVERAVEIAVSMITKFLTQVKICGRRGVLDFLSLGMFDQGRGQVTEAVADGRGEHEPQGPRKVFQGVSDQLKGQRWRLADLERVLQMFRGMSAKIIKAAGLIVMLVGRKDFPEGIAEGMAYRKLGEIAGKFVVDGAVIVSHIQFGEESSGGTDGTEMRDIVAAKQGLGGIFNFEANTEHWSDGSPTMGLLWDSGDRAVVSANAKRNASQIKSGSQDGNVVVGVVIISAGFTGEPHGGERSKLALHLSFQFQMETLQLGRNASQLHFV